MPDVLVVGRGGGSLEDLWCFNEEVLVRAVAASPIPVVSAVGHEIDVTLCDLAADVRALTPSEAAERVFPDSVELRAALEEMRRRLNGSLRARLLYARQRVASLADREVLRRPRRFIEEKSQYLDDLQRRADRTVRQTLAGQQRELAAWAMRLEALNPTAVLARGFSVTTDTRTERPIRSSEELQIGQELATRFYRGRVISRVERLFPPE